MDSVTMVLVNHMIVRDIRRTIGLLAVWQNDKK